MYGGFEVRAITAVPTVPGGTGLAYPNPWNPGTGPVTFQFVLSGSDQVTLPIIDIAGRKLYELSGSRPGYNKISWDGTTYTGGRVPNGMLLIPIVSRTQNKVLGKIKLMVDNTH